MDAELALRTLRMMIWQFKPARRTARLFVPRIATRLGWPNQLVFFLVRHRTPIMSGGRTWMGVSSYTSPIRHPRGNKRGGEMDD